ncbi:ribonuclease H family protein [Acetohalobium arabaticum]|uniref:ribonuclease H n=1 Tax=Acetohalobium arabaticum (strain ATCC 49924 / DSM 5501 / Z-7288) TaxID=574087 RepID=D9QQG6_ACEAZ|nr:ribonuclease H [Acetohalobium arabaticum]ADL12757.1 Ribonuclease H [Acetohalobium arabaticum DSM 5501]
MEMLVFGMEIISQLGDDYKIKVSQKDKSASFWFNPESKELRFCGDNKLSSLLKEKEYQLRKMLHTKRMDTYYVGFELKFCLRTKKDVSGFNDKERLMVVDKREAEIESYTRENYESNRIPKVYTDGSFLEELDNGAYAVIIKDEAGEYEYYTERVDVKNSNLIELLAAIKGVELLENRERIRIVTDSQYVRKGLAEWIINWRLNDWQTVNGEQVKHIDYWKKFDELTKGKYIELEWVKAHADHFENELCDIMARETAENDL